MLAGAPTAPPGRRPPPGTRAGCRDASPSSTTSTPTTTTRRWRRPWSTSCAPTASSVVFPQQRSSGIPEMLYGYADAGRGRPPRYNVAALCRPSQTGRRAGQRRADGQLRLQGALPRLPRQRGRARWSPTPPTTWASSCVSYRADHPDAAPSAPLRRLPSRRRLPPALPPQGAADRHPVLGAAARGPRAGGRRPRRRLLRHGRHLRHEDGHLRPLHAHRPAALRARGRGRARTWSPASAAPAACSSSRRRAVPPSHPAELLARAYGL